MIYPSLVFLPDHVFNWKLNLTLSTNHQNKTIKIFARTDVIMAYSDHHVLSPTPRNRWRRFISWNIFLVRDIFIRISDIHITLHKMSCNICYKSSLTPFLSEKSKRLSVYLLYVDLVTLNQFISVLRSYSKIMLFMNYYSWHIYRDSK